MDEWRTDILAIAPQTFIGFVNSTKAWQSWAFENIPDPPRWLSTGFIPYFRGQVFTLDEANKTQNGTGLIGFENIKQFAASISGLSGLDFVTFNGLTSLKAYFETNDLSQALCQTFPAQLATLYTSAFDASVPRDIGSTSAGHSR